MDTSENLKAGKYTNPQPYPSRGGAPGSNGRTKEEFIELRRAWLAETSRLERDVLKADLFEEWKVSGKKAETVWDRAWDRGHADGLAGVIWEFEDLVELILP